MDAWRKERQLTSNGGTYHIEHWYFALSWKRNQRTDALKTSTQLFERTSIGIKHNRFPFLSRKIVEMSPRRRNIIKNQNRTLRTRDQGPGTRVCNTVLESKLEFFSVQVQSCIVVHDNENGDLLFSFQLLSVRRQDPFDRTKEHDRQRPTTLASRIGARFCPYWEECLQVFHRNDAVPKKPHKLQPSTF